MKKPHRQNVIGWILVVIFLFAAAGLAFALTIIFAPVEMELKEDSYTLSFLTHEESAKYSEIAEIRLLDDKYSSDKITSYGGVSKEFGTFENKEFGEHFRLTYSENRHNYIMIRRTNGKVTVFNLKRKSTTTRLYRKLAAKVS